MNVNNFGSRLTALDHFTYKNKNVCKISYEKISPFEFKSWQWERIEDKYSCVSVWHYFTYKWLLHFLNYALFTITYFQIFFLPFHLLYLALNWTPLFFFGWHLFLTYRLEFFISLLIRRERERFDKNNAEFLLTAFRLQNFSSCYCLFCT